MQCRRCCFSPPSFCAGSEYAPAHTVPRCSLAGLVNHLPVTGGGNTTAGLAVQRVASGPLLSEVFGLLPLEMWICHFFHAEEKKSSCASFIFLYPERVMSCFRDSNFQVCVASVCLSAYMLVQIFALLVCVFASL